MGESKIRRRLLDGTTKPLTAVDVSNLASASSDQIRQLYGGVVRQLGMSFRQGMQPDVAVQVVLAAAIDTWRTNYGDGDCSAALSATINKRLEYPLDFYAKERQDGQGDV